MSQEDTRPYISLIVRAYNLRQACQAAVVEHKLYGIRAEQVNADIVRVDVRNVDGEATEITAKWFAEPSEPRPDHRGFPIGTLLCYSHHDPASKCPTCGGLGWVTCTPAAH
jgi:hypothetical protein